MPTESLTGKDTTTLNDKVLVDFGDGDTVSITYPNNIMNVKKGKNGNTIYSFNATGGKAEVIMRILLGSKDDKFLNSLLANMEQDPPSFVLLKGQFVKRAGDGKGNVSRSVYDLSGGVFTKRVETKENVEADTDQTLAIYTFEFGNASRSIQ